MERGPLTTCHGQQVFDLIAQRKRPAQQPTVPKLAKGKTDTSRIWTYVRDDRPFGGSDPLAVLTFALRDRRQLHPVARLAGWRGILHADAYGGYNELYDPERPADRSRRRFAGLMPRERNAHHQNRR